MKIKVINLLINLANGVTYTKKARIRYFDRKNDYEDECILNEVAIGYRLYNQNIELNDKIEIIEEKKIPEKLEYFDLTKDKNEKDENGNNLELHYTGVADTFDDVYDKINEIIDYLDYLKSKGE